ncbi:hypothetical protein GP486_001596 [Trichoglossum hirsutum]|uniref:polynucleotide adenylyltransferase n=1 Tax=Trichoglossum hirsutum TaxID=265104 RepID=A0A9P8LGE3_9PEZI|nr:hypothetical protein GP486_001596 [Trichoglossum hirsutum]
MPSKKPELSHPLPTRPGLQHNSSQVSQQSNSVPSTPHQHARKLSFDSRSPSPSGALNHSPRSAYSESNSTLLPLRKPPPGCKYEKGMTNSRRRMPYDIGDAKLEKARGQLKKKLSPDEERNLTQAMKDLYQRLLPSPESEDRRARFVQKLEKLLNDQWPGNDIQVRVFGSSGNKLCTFDSDVDICITTPMKELERVYGMERVVCVPNAKVPIVKIWDPELQLACDMNVNNTLALENTRMIRTYVDIDERVRPLAMIIKYWTKRRILNDAALGGTLSSYTWICMIINFLQTREPPILPSLHQRPHQRREFIDGIDVSFDDNLESLHGFGDRNRETLGELLFHFFRRYGHEIDYEKFVVSVRQGKLISKEEKMWHLMQNNRLCVEEPFNVKRNLGNTADDTSVRGLHIELRRAFTLIADEVNLEKCCEQYVWPVEQKPVWEKPPAQPRPVLSRSSSQTGRGGRGGHGNTRGGRHSNNHSLRGSSQQFRRASSGAAIANGPSGILPPHQAGISTQEYYMQAHHAQNQLQDQLYQSYQLLQAQLQESELRYHLLHQAQAQAQAQARNQTQSSAHTSGQASPAPYANGHASPHPGALDNPPLTAPVRPGFYFYPLQYPVPTQPHQPGASTNPSSPSITPAVPELRRSLHRSSVGERSGTGSFRSQSQPASRPLPSALNLQGLAASNYGLGGLSTYEQLRHQRREVHVDDPGDGQLETPLEPSPLAPGTDSSPDEQPKEYVGYYQIDAAQPVYNHLEISGLPHISAYGELPHRQRRVSPDQLPPPISNRLRQGSRSPPPLGSSPALLSGPQAGTPTPIFSQSNAMNETLTSAKEPVQDRPVENRSPLIVNGSTMSTYKGPVDGEPHLHHEEQNCGLCAPTFEPHAQDLPQSTTNESNRHKLYAQQLLEKHNQAETVKSEAGAASPSHGVRANHLTLSSPSIPAPTSPSPGASASHLQWPSDEEGNSSPRLSPNLRQRASRRVSLLPFNSIPPLDTTRTVTDATHEGTLSAASPLTPVPEMRTPSPTILRPLTAPLSTDPNGPKGVRSDRKSKVPQPPPTPASMAGKQKQADMPAPGVNGHVRGSASMGSGTPNNWQGPNKPKRRKSGAKKGPGIGKGHVEDLPTDESERKGG